MQVRFDRDAYRRRSQVETVISMIKRRQGAHVRSRSYHSQCRELRLMAITHNVMILWRREVFYRAFLTPFFDLIGSGRFRNGFQRVPRQLFVAAVDRQVPQGDDARQSLLVV